MEKKVQLKAKIRDQVGSRHTAALRKAGLIPAVVYGHKKKPLAVTLDGHVFVEALHHGHRLFDVQLDGKSAGKVIIKDLQYDYLGKDVIHADLVRVDITERIRVNVSLELKGPARGTAEGGILEEHVDHLEVECVVTDIPEKITVSVKDLDIGQNIHAGEVALPEGVKLITDPSVLLVSCGIVAAAKSAEQAEAEELISPEVIGKPAPTEEEPS